MKVTAPDLFRLGVIDEVISEPLGGAHRDPPKMIEAVKRAVLHQLEKLDGHPIEEIVEQRYLRFRRMGVFIEESGSSS